MASWADIKAKHRRTRVSVAIPMAADLADEHGRLAVELKRARDEDEQHNRDPQAPLIAQRMLDLEVEIRASEVTFTFEAIGRGAKRQLLRKHQPTDAQRDEASSQGVDDIAFNIDTYPPALLAASCVQVVDAAGDSVDVADIDWVEIWGDWNEGQLQRLWRACLAADAGVADTPKSTAASALISASGKS